MNIVANIRLKPCKYVLYRVCTHLGLAIAEYMRSNSSNVFSISSVCGLGAAFVQLLSMRITASNANHQKLEAFISISFSVTPIGMNAELERRRKITSKQDGCRIRDNLRAVFARNLID